MVVVATELHVRSFWNFFEFASLSFRSMKQAKKSEGNIHASARNKNWKIGYTLTVWESRETMLEFRNTGAHKKAMTKIRKVSKQYKTLVWEGDTIPTWDEAKFRLHKTEFKVLK
jgi:heme-degrading monooxygenase HmoA